jgi:hypothetical protein
MKLSTRILLTGLAIVIGFPIPLLTWLLPQEKINGYAMKTESTHYVVDMAWSVLDYYAQQVSAGKMPLAQAQSLAKASCGGSVFRTETTFGSTIRIRL